MNYGYMKLPIFFFKTFSMIPFSTYGKQTQIQILSCLLALLDSSFINNRIELRPIDERYSLPTE